VATCTCLLFYGSLYIAALLHALAGIGDPPAISKWLKPHRLRFACVRYSETCT
jgi:hypothetical protein